MALRRPPDVPSAAVPRGALVERLCWAGFLFVVVVGTVWHFVYAWSGETTWVGLMAPVNESLWEHTKLLVAPLLIWSAIEAGALPQRARLPWAAVASCVVGTTTIVVGFCVYVAALGSHRLWADIALFVLATALALVVHARVLLSEHRLPSWWIGVAVVGAIGLSYMALTVAPPGLGLFRAASG